MTQLVLDTHIIPAHPEFLRPASSPPIVCKNTGRIGSALPKPEHEKSIMWKIDIQKLPGILRLHLRFLSKISRAPFGVTPNHHFSPHTPFFIGGRGRRAAALFLRKLADPAPPTCIYNFGDGVGSGSSFEWVCGYEC